MRVAIVDVRTAAVRSVVAETTSRGPRRVLDRTVAVGLTRVLHGADDPAAAGTVDVLRETARRFHEAHVRLGVDRVLVTVDGELRDGLADVGLLAELADVLDAAILPSTPADELGALVRAVAPRGLLDDGPTLLVELAPRTARVGLVVDGALRHASRVALRDLGELATVARPRGGDGWLDLAVAAVVPILASMGAVDTRCRIVLAGSPVQALARVVVAREWRRGIRAVDRVRIPASVALALTTELGATTDGGGRPGVEAGEVDVVAGAAVVLSGLLAVTGAEHVLATDADRLEGHLDAARGTDVVARVLEVAGPPTDHARQVARLATSLFDGLAGTLGLTTTHRPVLEAAALIHDIARADGPGHHRRGGERVLDLPVRGVDPTTLVEVACLVRSQRGRPPGSHVPTFLRLSARRRAAVEQLVALLRLAEGLDLGHDDAVQRLGISVDPDPRGTGHPGGEPSLVCVDVLGEDVDLALYGARGQARHVERALGVRLVVRAAARPLAPT